MASEIAHDIMKVGRIASISSHRKSNVTKKHKSRVINRMRW